MVDLEGDYRSGKSAREKLAFCIEQLTKGDFKKGIDWDTEVVPHLSIEEIVGAILQARYEIEEWVNLEKERYKRCLSDLR
jgi:hypothetical protein